MTNEQIIKEKKRGDYWKNEYKVLRDYNIYGKKKHIKGTKNIYYVYVRIQECELVWCQLI